MYWGYEIGSPEKETDCFGGLPPKPEPWPPEEGSFDWCLYEKLGRPVDRMHSMDMYLAVAEKVWNEID